MTSHYRPWFVAVALGSAMLVVPMRAAPQPAAPAAAGPVRILLPLARTGGFAPAYVTWERGRG